MELVMSSWLAQPALEKAQSYWRYETAMKAAKPAVETAESNVSAAPSTKRTPQAVALLEASEK